MKRIFAGLLAVMALFGCKSAQEYAPRISLHFATQEEGRKITSTSDNYTRNLNAFDLQARLNYVGLEPTEANYLENAKKTIGEWTPEEKELLQKAAAHVQHQIDSLGYRLPLPEKITLIKSTMENEGRAGGYTRGTSIFLPSFEGMNPRRQKSLDVLFAHELFHVLTRNSPDFRSAMYEQVGFTLLKDNIDFPQVLLDMRISNPDVNRYDNYTLFRIDGKDVPCTLWFYTDRKYRGGSFFAYGKTGVVPLNDAYKPLLNEDGTPIIYSPREIEGFYDMLGRNTGYIINPEETLADNFAYAVLDYFPRGIPSPEVTERVKAVMRGSWIR